VAETIDPEYAGAWTDALGSDVSKLETVLAEKEAVACDQAAAFA
jgi:hypothetical protein